MTRSLTRGVGCSDQREQQLQEAVHGEQDAEEYPQDRRGQHRSASLMGASRDVSAGGEQANPGEQQEQSEGDSHGGQAQQYREYPASPSEWARGRRQDVGAVQWVAWRPSADPRVWCGVGGGSADGRKQGAGGRVRRRGRWRAVAAKGCAGRARGVWRRCGRWRAWRWWALGHALGFGWRRCTRMSSASPGLIARGYDCEGSVSRSPPPAGAKSGPIGAMCARARRHGLGRHARGLVGDGAADAARARVRERAGVARGR
jgi:hypothetical protein